jgi:hypothetical protein
MRLEKHIDGAAPKANTANRSSRQLVEHDCHLPQID